MGEATVKFDISELNLHYGEFHALKNINMKIDANQITAFIGPSGCGKSTALNLLCGLEAPTEGKIYFGDTDVTDMPPELRGVGMVFQNYSRSIHRHFG